WPTTVTIIFRSVIVKFNSTVYFKFNSLKMINIFLNALLICYGDDYNRTFRYDYGRNAYSSPQEDGRIL
ncbi:MAG: hypothetical protein Q8R37_03005, partial [Nanoarchaeota archaeon]|nr:hypothetical protein [Nanoarchaeota archaeon]